MKLIEFIVSWGPTLFFLAILALGFLVGFIRGRRKSRLSLIHKIISASIAILIFILFTNFDFIGIKPMIKDMVFELVNSSDQALAIALSDNFAYLLAFINLGYNLVFSLVACVVYWLFRIILFLTYLVFYPEWRHAQKHNKKLNNNLVEGIYKKRRLRGGFTGLIWSFFVGILALSSLGNLFYLFAGTGEEGLPSYTFDDESVNTVYEIVDSVETYGDTGVFKLLNSFRDSDNFPLYLYLGALPYSGKLEFSETESERIYFTHELGNYVAFLKDIASVTIKYNNDVIEGVLDGEPFSVDTIVSLLDNPSFRNDFREIIANYANNPTFISSFLFSTIESYVANIDKSSIAASFNDETKDLISILFVEGHVSKNIPYENAHQDEKYPCIKFSDLISKSDILAVYDLFIDLIDNGLFAEESDPIQMVLSALNHIESFRLFSPENENRDNINGTLGRLYAFVEATIFEEEHNTAFVNYSSHVNVKWIDEILDLIDMAPDLVDIYNVFNDPDFANFDTPQLVESLFSKFQDEKLLSTYDRVTDYVTSSGIATTLISSRFISQTIYNVLDNSFTNYTRPENLTLVNKVDEQGNTVYGEIYNFLRVLRGVVANEATKDLIVNLMDSDSDVNVFDLLKDGQDVLTKPDDVTNKSIIQFLTGSDLLRSVVSSFIITIAEPEDGFICVPDSARELDSNGNLTYIIKEKEFSVLLESIFTDYGETNVDKFGLLNVIDFDFFSKTEPHISELFIEDCGNLFENEKINAFLNDSFIIQASIGKIISYNRETLPENIILPDSLIGAENWVTTEDNPSEIYKIFIAIRELLGDTRELLDPNFTIDSFLEVDRITDLNHPSKIEGYTNKTRTEVVLDSQLLYHNLSKVIIDIPDSVEFDEDSQELYDALVNGINDSKVNGENLIKLEEFKKFVDVIDVLYSFDGEDSSDINDFAEKVEDLFNNVSNLLKPVEYGLKVNGNKYKDKPLNVFYSSSIIKQFFSVALDNTLEDIMGDKDPDYNKLDTFKQNGVYYVKDIQDLLEGLVICIDDGNIGEAGKDLIDVFTSLQDEVGYNEFDYIFDKGESSTKLEKLYSSNIVEILFTDILQEEIASNSMLQDHPDAYTLTDVGSHSVYKVDEISILVDMFNELSTSEDLDFDNISTDNLHLDTLKTLLYGEVSSAQQATVKSNILYSTISKNVLSSDYVIGTDSIDPQIIIPNISIDSSVQSVDGDGYIDLIIESELYSLLDFACIIEVGSVDDFANFDDKLNDFKLSTIKPFVVDCNIIRATVSDKLYDVSYTTENSIIIPDATLQPDVSVKMIFADEINNVIDFSMELGLNSVGDVTGSDSAFNNNDNFNLTKVSEFIYPLDKREDASFDPELNTSIVRSTLSNKIISLTTNLGSIDDLLYYPEEVISSVIQTSETDAEVYYKTIKTGELINLLDAMNQVTAENSSINYFENIEVNSFALEQAEEMVKTSLIVRATTSMKLVEGEENYLVVPYSAKELKAGTEMEYEEITIVTTHQSNINQEEIVVVSIDELVKLFDALEIMNVDSVSKAHDVDEETLDPVGYEKGVSTIVSKSAILRATITEHVSFEDDFGIMAIRSLVYEIDVNVSAVNHADKVNVLHDHEIEHLLDGFTSYNKEKAEDDTSGAFECSLSLATLQALYNSGAEDNALSVMLTSDIFRIAICQVLNENPLILIDTTIEEVFCFEDNSIVEMLLSTKEDIELCIGQLGSLV